MKKISLIILGLLVMVGIALYVLSLFSAKNTSPGRVSQTPDFGTPSTQTDSGVVQNNPGHIYPIQGSVSTSSPTQPQSVTLSASDGSLMTVKNFLQNSDTAQDPINPGLYYLGYRSFDLPNSPGNLKAPYYIIYDKSQTFTIALNQEPISQNRLLMEQDLEARLGISQQSICKLRYIVSVPLHVNQYYYGYNLGFSFCPGAVKLAQ